MSTWDNEYYEDEPDGYGSDPDPDDPQGILRRDRDAEIEAHAIKPPFATLTDATGPHIVGGRVEISPLIRDAVWEKIREQFTGAEKAALRAAIAGQVICPKGVIVDTDLLDAALRDKLTAAVGKTR